MYTEFPGPFLADAPARAERRLTLSRRVQWVAAASFVVFGMLLLLAAPNVPDYPYSVAARPFGGLFFDWSWHQQLPGRQRIAIDILLMGMSGSMWSALAWFVARSVGRAAKRELDAAEAAARWALSETGRPVVQVMEMLLARQAERGRRESGAMLIIGAMLGIGANWVSDDSWHYLALAVAFLTTSAG